MKKKHCGSGLVRTTSVVCNFSAAARHGCVAVAVIVGASFLSSCALVDDFMGNTEDDAAYSYDESATFALPHSAVFSATPVAPITAEDPLSTTHDAGINADITFVSAKWTGGGLDVRILLKNTGDAPLPPEALGTPTLEVTDFSGKKEKIPLGDPDTDNTFLKPNGLDLPLGAGASTHIHYFFDVSWANLSNATLTIANVIISGNLS